MFPIGGFFITPWYGSSMFLYLLYFFLISIICSGITSDATVLHALLTGLAVMGKILMSKGFWTPQRMEMTPLRLAYRNR